jgi:hypothetical protein
MHFPGIFEACKPSTSQRFLKRVIQFFPFDFKSIVYLCAKFGLFGALNPRINRIRSGRNRLRPVPQVQTLQILYCNNFLLSDLVVMFPWAPAGTHTVVTAGIRVSGPATGYSVEAKFKL